MSPPVPSPVPAGTERAEAKRQPCNDYAAEWRGEHAPHVWERASGQLRQCPGRAFTREQRWDQALSEWAVFRAADGQNSIGAASDDEVRAECMALADAEVAAALAAVVSSSPATPEGGEREDWPAPISCPTCRSYGPCYFLDSGNAMPYFHTAKRELIDAAPPPASPAGVKRPCSVHGDSMNIRCAECHTYPASPAETAAKESAVKCPRCESPSPTRHPAVQFEGEVQVCPDPFHASTEDGRRVLARAASPAETREGREWCQECGSRNVDAWFVDSALWNEVVPERSPILCPSCFAGRFERLHPGKAIWELRLDNRERVYGAASPAVSLPGERPVDALRERIEQLATLAEESGALVNPSWLRRTLAETAEQDRP